MLFQSFGYISLNLATKSCPEKPVGKAAATDLSFSSFFITICPFGVCFLPTVVLLHIIVGAMSLDVVKAHDRKGLVVSCIVAGSTLIWRVTRNRIVGNNPLPNKKHLPPTRRHQRWRIRVKQQVLWHPLMPIHLR